MPLYWFALVIGSLSCGSLPAMEGAIGRPLAATIGMVAGWTLLCHVGARLLARQVVIDRVQPHVAARGLERQLELFRWLGLAVALFCLAGFGLARVLDATPLLCDSMFLKAVVLLAPGVMLGAANGSAENLFGILLGYTERSLRGHLQTVWLAFRGGAAWLIAPVLLLLGAVDLIRLLPLTSEATTLLTAVTLLVAVPLGIPVLVRFLFKTAPLDLEMAAWIDQLFAAAGMRSVQAVRWDTGGRGFNAMVAGMVAPLRTLLISDRILDEMPRPQLAMVLLHEAAHIRRRHVPLRMVLLLPAWGIAMLLTRILGESDWAMTAGSVVGILLTMVILRFVAHRTELDADAHACRLAAEIAPSVAAVPATEEAAAKALAAALTRVTRETPAAREPSWLHPGLADRLRSLGSAEGLASRECP